MGLLKKIFKPVSKVLDKIIPNELKPILPYAAAFAPYAMPGIMGIGGNTMFFDSTLILRKYCETFMHY